MRILYLAGPGNAFHTFECWRQGLVDEVTSHVGYSSQFYDVCRELGAQALVLTTNAREGASRVEDGDITVERMPSWTAGARGVGYHWAQTRLARDVIARARAFRADVVLAPEHPYAFLLLGLRRHGIKLVQTLHCVLWPLEVRPSPLQAAMLTVLGAAYPNSCDAILSASADIGRQVRTVTARAHRRSPPVVDFLPLYRAEMYGGVPRATRGKDFRVLFVGRVERNKGVFDLLEIAAALRTQGRRDIVFELCGSGGALDELRAETQARGLADQFVIHGWCDRDALRAAYERCQASVVPTTTMFNEGFNQVVVESLLAGRPVITSRVCPALAYVRDAVCEVPPDDRAAYQAAVVRLADDAAYYERLRGRCGAVSQRFLDPAFSFAAGLRRVFGALKAGAPVEPLTIPVQP